MEYFIDSLGLDPITLVVVFATVVLLLISRRAVPMLGAFSILLYLGYTLMIGGDFMSGRFFALPFCLPFFSSRPVWLKDDTFHPRSSDCFCCTTW